VRWLNQNSAAVTGMATVAAVLVTIVDAYFTILHREAEKGRMTHRPSWIYLWGDVRG